MRTRLDGVACPVAMNPETDRTLCFIADHDQWIAAIEMGQPAATDIVVTASPQIYFECRLQGRPCLSLWSYLPASESVLHLKWVWDLCISLGEGLQVREDSRYPGLSRDICHDACCALLVTLNLSCSISRLLDERKPKRIRLFSEANRPLFWDASRPEPDIFNWVAGWEAGRRGIETSPMALSPAVREAIRLANVPPRLPDPDPEAPMVRDPVHALLFTQSISRSEQEPLFASLRRDFGDRVVTVMPEPDSRIGPFLSWAHMRRLPIRTPVAPSEDALGAVLAAAVSGPDWPDYARVLGSPEFAAFFLRGWQDWLGLAAVEEGVARLTGQAYRPRLAILPYDVEGPVRRMAATWNTGGVPVLVVDHVGLSTWDGAWRNRGAVASAAVWGAHDAEAHQRCRDPSARVFQTGSMRCDLASAARLGTTPRTGSGRSPAVLIITSQYGSELMIGAGYSGPEMVLSWWDELCALSVRARDWDWKLKTHPRFDHEAFYRYLMATRTHRLEPAAPDLLEALASADVMLLMANPSTSAAHAILAGVPVIYFKPPVTPEFWHSPIENGGAVVVSDMPSLETALRQSLADEASRRGVAASQRAFLDRVLVATGDASVRLVRAAIEELQHNGPAAAAPDPAARWIADLTMMVEYGLRGVWPWREFRRRLRELGARGRTLAFDHLDFLDAGRLPDYFMNIALLSIWRRPEADRRISRRRPWLGRILWEIRRTLPDSIRPPAGWLRPYLRRTVEEEAALNPASRFWSALRRKVAAA